MLNFGSYHYLKVLYFRSRPVFYCLETLLQDHERLSAISASTVLSGLTHSTVLQLIRLVPVEMPYVEAQCVRQEW